MKGKTLFLLLVATAALSGCGDKRRTVQDSRASATSTSFQARAVLQPTSGHQASGTVLFIEEPGGVRVVGDFKGLSPGKHGFHVHEKGDCSAPDATSAGGHFGPGGTPHGGPDNPRLARHAGDLGNIEAKADGTARYERLDPVLRLQGTESIIGRALLVHAGPDDLVSQPAGNSGDRVACGIISTP